MDFTLPPLPYDKHALEPHISAQTLTFHHEKHHQGYVEKLRKAIEGTAKAKQDLLEIIRDSEGGVFNNAAQVWNHTFFWHSLSPDAPSGPDGELAAAIDKDLGGYDQVKRQLAEAASGHFGSGWAWLSINRDGKLEVTSTPNAVNPLVSGDTPLLTIDVWEHAYYLDFQNRRAAYVQAVVDHLLDWKQAAKRFENAHAAKSTH
jgi:Fe-Mn family superoxide dismutase